MHEGVNVLEVIQRSTDFFAKKGVDSPRLQIELLLAQALKMPRLNLYLDFERELSEAELETVRQMVKRRGRREPLQHITGSTSFCGLEMNVTPAVLVPRPETEILAELAWKFLNGLAARNPASVSALDFGTGSGCLSVAIAAHAPAARFVALDVSKEALEVASRNAASHGVSDRIQFMCSDGFAGLPVDGQFDLIVSNPPYIATAEIETLQPEVREHDPRLALDGGADGLDFYRMLAAQSKRFLRPAGKLMIEFGDGQEEPIRVLFLGHGWKIETVARDNADRPRVLVGRP